jgi:hypothetical protein
MMPIQFLFGFLPSNFDLPRVRHNNVVTAVHCTQYLFKTAHKSSRALERTTRIIYGLMLAHEHSSYPSSKFAQDTVGSVGVVPYSSKS